MYYFEDIDNFYVLDEKLNIVEKIKASSKEELIKKYRPKKLEEEWQFEKVLEKISPKNLKQIREFCIKDTKKKLQQGVTQDMLIIQTINNIEELDKTINLHAKRLREWFSYYLPELIFEVEDNNALVLNILQNSKEQLMKKFKIQETVGSKLEPKDIDEMKKLAELIIKSFELKDTHLKYLESVMKSACPNLLELAGPSISGKLIAQAGSLKALAEFPSSTLQLLGAEKALFRHLRKHTRPPKYGIILNHPVVAQAKEKGKAARALASILSIAAKVDYFKGEFIAQKLKKDLERKLK